MSDPESGCGLFLGLAFAFWAELAAAALALADRLWVAAGIGFALVPLTLWMLWRLAHPPRH